jgi:hypothetical protein
MLRYIPNIKGSDFEGFSHWARCVKSVPKINSDEKIIPLPGFDADSNKKQRSKRAKPRRSPQKQPGQ